MANDLDNLPLITEENCLRYLVYFGLGSGGRTGATNGGSGTKRTPNCIAAIASGSTTDGVKSVTLLASSDFAGTVLGQPLAVSASISFTAPVGDTLGSFAYTRSAGTLYIYYVP